MPAPITTPRSKLPLEISLFILVIIAVFFLSFFYFAGKDKSRSTVLPDNKNITPTLTLAQKCTSVTLLPESGGNSSSDEKTPKTPIIGIQIDAEKDAFSPAQFTVRQNQVISLIVSAKDKTYDFSLPGYGLSVTIPQGENKPIQFQATNIGQFVFSCRENCKDPQTSCGFLTVKP